jgi:hypothetical protein
MQGKLSNWAGQRQRHGAMETLSTVLERPRPRYGCGVGGGGRSGEFMWKVEGVREEGGRGNKGERG